MAGKSILLGMWLAWVVPALGGELSTVAYVLGRAGFEELGSEWRWRSFDDVDPFAEEQDETAKAAAPMRLEHEPNGSRFFAEGDEMWLLTGTLLQQKLLTNERSWAVWNAGTGRLVVHGTLEEHRVVAGLCREMIGNRLTQVELGLVKVRCRELGAVDWTEEEVRKRGAKKLGSVAVKSRPGQKATVDRDGGKMGLEVESNLGPYDEIMDVRFRYSAEVDHADGTRRLELSTALVLLSGERTYYELGGVVGAEETYLAWVEGEVQLINGLPARQWREFETPEKKKVFLERNRKPGKLDDGTRIRRWVVPPTFLEGIQQNEPGSVDPNARLPLKPMKNFAGLGGEQPARDLGEIMKDAGIAIPESGWVCYLEGSSTLVARLDDENLELVDALVGDGGPPSLPPLIHTTVSVIEWNGELEPGRIPAGAQRLARAAVVGRPGQKLLMRHGWPAEELKRGISLLVEPNIGANGRIVDVRIDLEMAGDVPLQVSTGLTVSVGKPVVVPLGKVGGKWRGLVVESRSSGWTQVEVNQ